MANGHTFSQEELVVIMESYEAYKTNTSRLIKNKVATKCQRKVADDARL